MKMIRDYCACCGSGDFESSSHDTISDRYFLCLSDPVRRSMVYMKISVVMLHLIFLGALFLFDTEFRQKFTIQPWYMAMYLLLFVVTLAQYFFTAGSSPGYVLDAMRTVGERDPLLARSMVASKNELGRNPSVNNTLYWAKLVMDMYPVGTSARTYTCSYCNVLQPPRVKHCHDCDKCVLQFDHHCVWLGTCIGQGNHCRFWWYLCEETALCVWTGILFISFLKANILKAWWVDIIMILLLATLSISLIFLLLLLLFHSYLVLTNQTTFELVRRRRIPYLRGIPERVYPFSKGVCRNLYNFCCDIGSIYRMESLPTAQELEEKSRPYTCLNVLSCRCCC